MTPSSQRDEVAENSDENAVVRDLEEFVAQLERLVAKHRASVAELSKQSKLRRRDRRLLGKALLRLRSNAEKSRDLGSLIERMNERDNTHAVSESLRRLAATNSAASDAMDSLTGVIERVLSR